MEICNFAFQSEMCLSIVICEPNACIERFYDVEMCMFVTCVPGGAVSSLLFFICFWFRNGIGLTSAVQPTENNVWSVSKARADGVAHDSLLIPGCTLLSRNRELTRGSLFKTRNCLLGCASQVPMLVGGRVGGISLGKLNGPIPLPYILLMFS